MSTYLKGLADGQLLYDSQKEIGRVIDQLRAINIVKMFMEYNTTEKLDYWLGYYDALCHCIKLDEEDIQLCVLENEELEQEKAA